MNGFHLPKVTLGRNKSWNRKLARKDKMIAFNPKKVDHRGENNGQTPLQIAHRLQLKIKQQPTL